MSLIGTSRHVAARRYWRQSGHATKAEATRLTRSGHGQVFHIAIAKLILTPINAQPGNSCKD